MKSLSVLPFFHASVVEFLKSSQISRNGKAILCLMLSLSLVYGCTDKNEISQDTLTASQSKEDYLHYLQQLMVLNGQLTLRSGDFSALEAVDYLNESLNFLYCRPDTFFAESLFFLDTITMPLNGSGRIDEADLEVALDDIAEFAGNKYYAESRSEKIPIIFNVRQISANILYCEVEATFAMEAGANNLNTDYYPYNFDWVYGQWGEDVSEECNEENVNADAADLLRRDLRKALAYRSKSGPAYYFKNPYTVCFSPATNQCLDVEIPINFFPADEVVEPWELINGEDSTPNDNYEEYLLFLNYSGDPNFHECITDNEMNFHYESMYELGQGVLPNPVGFAVIAQIEVGYELLLGTFSRIHHSMLVTRAIKAPILEEEFEEAIPLPN